MEDKFKIKSTRLLVVEGKDECNFFKALLKHLDIKDVQLVDVGGINKFQYEFPTLYNMEGFNKVNVIGFIRDAEKKPAENAFNSICNIIKKYDLPVPNARGIVCKLGIPNTAIFIMPDNAGTGMLENLCLKTIESTPFYDCVIKYVECFSQHQSLEEKKKFNEPKSKVQTYLASRSPIFNSLGLGAFEGYWDFNHSCLNEIKGFLKSLFL